MVSSLAVYASEPAMSRFLTSNYDVRHLRTFLAVVEHGGLSSAAYRLGASLSSVESGPDGLRDAGSASNCAGGAAPASRLRRKARTSTALRSGCSRVCNRSKRLSRTRASLSAAPLMLGTIDGVITNPNAGIVSALAKMHRLFPEHAGQCQHAHRLDDRHECARQQTRCRHYRVSPKGWSN